MTGSRIEQIPTRLIKEYKSLLLHYYNGIYPSEFDWTKCLRTST